MTTTATVVDAAVTAERSREILESLAAYHGLSAFARAAVLGGLEQVTEQRTIRAFYDHFTNCKCPTTAILLCIIEDIKSNGKSTAVCR